MMDDEIKAKLLMSDDDLFAEVGQSLGKGATFTDALKRGRQVVDNLGRQLKTSVCSNTKVIACFKASDSDEVKLIAAIITALGVLHAVPPVNVAILLFRTGLKKYCGHNWPPEG